MKTYYIITLSLLLYSSKSISQTIDKNNSSLYTKNVGVDVSRISNNLVQKNSNLLTNIDFNNSPEPSKTSYITRLNADGTIDNTFNPGTGANNTVAEVATQPDGKLIIAGYFTSFSGKNSNHIVRLNANGTIDHSFNPGTGADNGVDALALQPDGKILIGGSFNTYNGTSVKRVARLNADGTLDKTFKLDKEIDGLVFTMLRQPNGKILVGGYFNSFNGKVRFGGITRLNADGSFDKSFNPGEGALFSSVYAITLQPDGKILIGGDFRFFNGIMRDHIARLNADGSVDESFDSNRGVNEKINTIALQADGKILIGGDFTKHFNTSRNKIARLNTNGSLDKTFESSVGANYTVRTITLQPDEKILVGGNFTKYNGINRNQIARLNADGTLTNDTFNRGTGANGDVRTLVLQPDGKILVLQFLEVIEDKTQPCPNLKKLENICIYIDSRGKDPKPKGDYVYMYQRRLLDAACVDVEKDSEEVIGEKIRKMWDAAFAQQKLNCHSIQFYPSGGNILKFAVSSKFTEFIDDAIWWKVNLNFIDEVDKETVLDYVRGQIEKNKGTSIVSTLQHYYKILREAGAKHAAELKK
ncbi:MULTISPECIES: delta-60 repeat domain-containing protein [unclassified Sediminibacterium]|jgi:uncharacterized delta-60 repeat protein|uniref:WD40 repeat domain-containing protein n=1 Tax=unclassified Sediminibacterium TaxID=2635961 RepID=UPI0025EC370C|nr:MULTISPECIES: delta-60 repeat domain-containing protein [unclassified Sediminibacterium]